MTDIRVMYCIFHKGIMQGDSVCGECPDSLRFHFFEDQEDARVQLEVWAEEYGDKEFLDMEIRRVEVRDTSMDDYTYLIWSDMHKAWWGPNNRGYYIDDRAAGRYTREEAQEIVDRASPDRKEIAVKLCNVREFARTGVSEGIK